MIHYKDRTFCTFYTECRTGEYCISALTEEVKERAKQWWKVSGSSDEAPISVFSDKPLCFEEKED